MNKTLSFHKKNVDQITEETTNVYELRYIYYLAIAVQYILERMNKQEEKMNYYTRIEDKDGSFAQKLADIDKIAEKLFGEMRDLKPEERKAYSEYIKSISVDTGVNIWDFYEKDNNGEQ